MNINNLIALLIAILIGLTIFGLSNNTPVLVTIGHIFILPMIGIWYGFKRHWQITAIDIAVYTTYLVGSFSDSFILFGGQIGETLQISMTLLMHMILIIIFRQEGTRIYSEKLKDLPKILVPVSIIFIFFGTVLIPILPDIHYFLLIFYAIQEMILISHGLFRQVKGKSYWWVAVGVSLILVKDMLYCYNFFVYQNKILFLYIIQYTLSATVYFMIAVGLAYNNQNRKQEKSIKQYIQNSIKLLLNNHRITQFSEFLKLRYLSIKVLFKRNFLYLRDVLKENKPSLK